MTDNKNKFPVRTDLAVEAREMIVKEKAAGEDATGVNVEHREMKGIKIDHIVVNQQGSEQIDKKPGSYITIYADGVKKQDTKKQADAAHVMAKELEQLLKNHHIKQGDVGLIVGLGNWQITPDALGPMTVGKVLVTNHLFVLEHETVSEGYRPVAAVSPGVMGTTGMETSDIVFGVIEKLKPLFVIVVDALASRSIERINETIQLTDTGIHPGSGVGNKRKELSEDTLGIPVIAIGVPTVVDAVTITSDTIDYLLKHFGREWKEKDRPSKSLTPGGLSFGTRRFSDTDLPDEEKRQTFLGMVGTLTEEEKRSLITEVLSPVGHNLIVTPKEVDSFMEDMADLISKGINAALHEKIDPDNVGDYTR